MRNCLRINWYCFFRLILVINFWYCNWVVFNFWVIICFFVLELVFNFVIKFLLFCWRLLGDGVIKLGLDLLLWWLVLISVGVEIMVFFFWRVWVK